METSIILTDSFLISEGASRRCYYHPFDDKKCLKIVKKGKLLNEKDLAAYEVVKSKLSRYVAMYDNSLIDTNLGKALVSELVRDYDGALSESLDKYVQNNVIEKELFDQIINFFEIVNKNKFLFYDFNFKNFLVQRGQFRTQLRYTDLKSLGETKSFFPIEKIPYFSRMKLQRRKKRFIHNLLSLTLTSEIDIKKYS